MKQLDFGKIERKWQKRWAEKKIFESKVEKKPKFFLTTPYPYVSGSPHIGHGRAVSECDVYARYKRMKGFNVLFSLGFHISGTPVLGIAAAIKNGDVAKIELYESYVRAYVDDEARVKKIIASFVDPQKIVDFFVPKMQREYQELGVGIDWRRSFTSGDLIHQKLVAWQFTHYADKGYLSKERYPVLYSPRDESAMGEDDIQDADSDPVEKVEFTLLKYRYGSKFLVAATVRPETIYGQTNLWINSKVTYVEARVGKETWIMSKEAFDKLSYQRSDITFAGICTDKLIGIKVHAPMIDRTLMVLPSRFVDSDMGSGIVTSVPSDAPYDYVALTELQSIPAAEKQHLWGLSLKEIEELEDIEVIPVIQTKRYGDKSAVAIVEKHSIMSQDDERLAGLTKEIYSEGFHTGVLLSSCGAYAGMSVSIAKEAMKKQLLDDGNAAVFYDVSRKAVSRSGGKIVVAMLDNQWFLNFNAPGWKDRARECLAQMRIEPESMRNQFESTFDWLDKRPCARKRGLGTPLPADPQWMIESLSDSTLYMVLYSIAHLVSKHKLKARQLSTSFFDYVCLGKGISKSVAKEVGMSESVLKECRSSFEYWMPVDHRHTFSLHLSNHLSFMIFAFAALFPEKAWPKKISFHGLVVRDGVKMSKSKGNVITLLQAKKEYAADVFRFYLTQSTSLEGTFDWRDSEADAAKASIERLFSIVNEAIHARKKGVVPALYVSRVNRIIKQASEKLDQMKLREYNMLAVFEMLNLVRQARLDLTDKELAALYYYLIPLWVPLIAPVCPHVAEELWERAKGKGLVSVSAWPTIDESKINDVLEAQATIVDRTVSDVMNVLTIVREKQGEADKVYLYVLPKEVSLFSRTALEKRIGKTVQVFAVNDAKKYDPQGKASKAKPGKPAIYVE